ncbi:MAG TPA: Hsp20/alpha crystallin family protein [Chloroflexi bacterium]|nr:Hsp20/alpha crystallin family protein [Chloroflexota bacterium]
MSAKRSASGGLDRVEEHYHILMRERRLYVLRHNHLWQPPTDVMEDKDRLYVIVEIAGMQNSEFHVTISNRLLTISGVRPPRPQTCTAYHQIEIHHGEFYVEVNLPWPVDKDAIVAHYEDGFLRVELPRAGEQDIQVVEVNKARK